MSQNAHTGETPTTQDQNNAMSDDPADGHRLTDKPTPIGKKPAEKAPERGAQDHGSAEEFGRQGMGISAKE
jgi:hypothetical protein